LRAGLLADFFFFLPFFLAASLLIILAMSALVMRTFLPGSPYSLSRALAKRTASFEGISSLEEDDEDEDDVEDEDDGDLRLEREGLTEADDLCLDRGAFAGAAGLEGDWHSAEAEGDLRVEQDGSAEADFSRDGPGRGDGGVVRCG
jgi:hypothetical protein